MGLDISKTNESSEKLNIEGHKSYRKELDTQGKIAKEQLSVAKESLKVIQSFADVWKEHKKLQQTEVEWEGRVEKIKEEVTISENDLKKQLSKEKSDIKKIESLEKHTESLLKSLNNLTELVNELPLGDERMKWTKIINEKAEKLARLSKEFN